MRATGDLVVPWFAQLVVRVLLHALGHERLGLEDPVAALVAGLDLLGVNTEGEKRFYLFHWVPAIVGVFGVSQLKLVQVALVQLEVRLFALRGG